MGNVMASVFDFSSYAIDFMVVAGKVPHQRYAFLAPMLLIA
jgi:hypothetical protein